ncbi:hypothetical protein SLEP1_g50125 [Rubroshorea leprosula]|uniref:Uncharacterized protein n=1 Tax=Rubroshorea leprosula TaxID=152421 RepID=A0AAV5LZS8_9ROSI|nr:hypothetical protein SLEP1_g50125 [Rubroshorea leprosula]
MLEKLGSGPPGFCGFLVLDNPKARSSLTLPTGKPEAIGKEVEHEAEQVFLPREPRFPPSSPFFLFLLGFLGKNPIWVLLGRDRERKG